MPVLIEATSVVVRRAAIERRYPGGWDAFARDAPNATLCADAQVARLGFMNPYDVEAFVRRLERRGLVYLVEGAARDFVVVDQQTGPWAPCDWLEFQTGSFSPSGREKVVAGAMAGDSFDTVEVPDAWEYEGSLSQTFVFVPDGELTKSLRYLRHENGIDVYLNLVTGKEVYEGRTGE